MMAFYSLGLQITASGKRMIVVDIRSGEVVGHDLHAVSVQQIVGVGVSFSKDVSRPNITSESLGLPPDVPIAPPILNTHACVLGAGVAAPSTLVMFVNDQSLHVLNSRVEASFFNPAKDVLLPEYFTYEIHAAENEDAVKSAFALRKKCDDLRQAAAQVRRFVACGNHPPQTLQTYADVLDAKIKLPASAEPGLLGAAIMGCIISKKYPSFSQAIHAMAHQRKDLIFRPDLRTRKIFDAEYENFAGD